MKIGKIHFDSEETAEQAREALKQMHVHFKALSNDTFEIGEMKKSEFFILQDYILKTAKDKQA